VDQYGVVGILCAAGTAGMLGSGYASYQKHKKYLIDSAVDGLLPLPLPERKKEWSAHGLTLRVSEVMDYVMDILSSDNPYLTFIGIGPDLADRNFREGRFNEEIALLKNKEAKMGRVYLD
jgi:hypothetical protein